MFLLIYTFSFRSAGEIWAASLAQSGPPNFGATGPCVMGRYRFSLWCGVFSQV